MGHWSGYLFVSLRVVLLAHGPDGQASPRDGTSPRRDERSKPRAIVALCWVAETPDEASCRRYSQNLALACVLVRYSELLGMMARLARLQAPKERYSVFRKW
jgi:hypothetical protein